MRSERRIFLSALVVLALGAPTRAQQTKLPPPTERRPLPERVERFERPERDQWLKPDEVIKALGLRKGAVVADIGAGSGYFARRFARVVAPKGKVYAVDISADVMGYLKERAAKEGLANLETIVSREDDPLLPARAVDLAFFSDTTHHIANRASFFKKVRETLKTDGRMAIIDYAPDAKVRGFCSHEPEELVPVWQLVKEADEAGFDLVGVHTFLPRSYFLVFALKEPPPAAAPPSR
jgi:cyclopropane fatty-acyl-phospholipid synthase-like methyltransferase